uniref:Uncharacterized protein n=1 Tax=Arundo donax TaxID=35708 RepID=A0A0A8YMV5_ARUDO
MVSWNQFPSRQVPMISIRWFLRDFSFLE